MTGVTNNGKWLVKDGDTVQSIETGETFRIADIDAPETAKDFLNKSGQMGGEEASTALLDFANSSGFSIQSDGEKDKYGRTLGRAVSAERDYQAESIRSGSSQRAFDDDDTYLHSQVQGAQEAYASKGYSPEKAKAALNAVRQSAAEKSPYRNYNNAFQDAVARGGNNMQAMAYGFSAALGESTGFDALQNWGEDGIVANLKEAAIHPARIQAWDDVGSLEEFGTFFVEAIGEQLPQLGVDAALFAATGGTATAARAGFAKALKRKMGDEVFSKWGKRGAIASIYGQSSGETATELYSQGVEDYGATALVTGAPKTALEYMPLARMLKEVKAVSGLTGSQLGQVASRLATQAGIEGSTEGMQTILDFMATSHHLGKDVFDEENLAELRTAVAKGALVGGSFTAPGALPPLYRAARARYLQSREGETSVDNSDLDQDINDFHREVSGEGGTEDISPENFATKDAPSTESQQVIDAQAAAVSDPTSTKDSIQITDGSPPPSEGVLPEDIIQVDAENGPVFTTNPETAAIIEATGGDQKSVGQALYGAEDGKAGTDGTTIVARNAQGVPVSEFLTSETRVEEDIAKAEGHAPEGGSVEVATVESVLKEREQRKKDELRFKADRERAQPLAERGEVAASSELGGRSSTSTDGRVSGVRDVRSNATLDKRSGGQSATSPEELGRQRLLGGRGRGGRVGPISTGSAATNSHRSGRDDVGRDVSGRANADNHTVKGFGETTGEADDNGIHARRGSENTADGANAHGRLNGLGDETSTNSQPTHPTVQFAELTGDERRRVLDRIRRASRRDAPLNDVAFLADIKDALAAGAEGTEAIEHALEKELGHIHKELGQEGFGNIGKDTDFAFPTDGGSTNSRVNSSEGENTRLIAPKFLMNGGLESPGNNELGSTQNGELESLVDDELERAEKDVASIRRNNHGEQQSTFTQRSFELLYPTIKFTKFAYRSYKNRMGQRTKVYGFKVERKTYPQRNTAQKEAKDLQEQYPNDRFEVVESSDGYRLERVRLPAPLRPEIDDASQHYSRLIGKALINGLTAQRNNDTSSTALLISPKGGKRVHIHLPTITEIGMRTNGYSSHKNNSTFLDGFSTGVGVLAEKGWSGLDSLDKSIKFGDIAPTQQKLSAERLAHRKTSNSGSRSDAEWYQALILDTFSDSTAEIQTFLEDFGMTDTEIGFLLGDLAGEAFAEEVDQQANDITPPFGDYDSGPRRLEDFGDSGEKLLQDPLHPQEPLRDESGKKVPGKKMTSRELDRLADEDYAQRGRKALTRQAVSDRGANTEQLTQNEFNELNTPTVRSAFVGGSASSTPLSPIEVSDTISEFKQSLAGNLDIDIVPVEDMSLITTDPERLAKYEQTKGYIADRGVGHPDGRYAVVINTRNHASASEVTETLRHEVLGHYGLAKFWTPEERRAILQRIVRAKRSSLKEEWAYVERNYPESSTEVQAEEVFALVAEKPAEHTVWRSLKALFNRVLKRAGFISEATTREELESLHETIAQGFRDGITGNASPEITQDTFRKHALAKALTPRRAAQYSGRVYEGMKKLGTPFYTGLYQLSDISQKTSAQFRRYWAFRDQSKALWEGEFQNRVGLNEEATNAAWKELVELGETDDISAAGENAQKLHQFLDRFHRLFQKKYMPTLGRIKNYVPQLLDIRELDQRKQEFVEILTSHQLFDSHTNISVAAAEAIHRRLVDNNGSYDHTLEDMEGTVGPGHDHRHKRVLRSPEMIAALEEAGFMYSDKREAIDHYLTTGINRASYERVFGGYAPITGWSRNTSKVQELEMLRDRLLREGRTDLIEAYGADHRKLMRTAIEQGYAQEGEVEGTLAWYSPTQKITEVRKTLGADERHRFDEIINGFMGRFGSRMSPEVRRWQSGVMAYESLLTLSFSTLSSFPDFAGPILRVMQDKGVKDAFGALRQAVRGMGNGEYKQLKEQARDMGLLNHRQAQEALKQMWGHEHNSPFAQKIMSGLFKYNGQEWLTNHTRVFSAGVATRYFTKLADSEDVTLGDYGLDPDTVKQWNADGQPALTAQLIEEGGERADRAAAIHEATHKFVDESVIRPNAGQKPVWANDPRFALLWHLKSFFYAYWSVLLQPTYTSMLQQVQKGNVAEGAGQMAMMAAMMLPLAAAGWEIREALQYSIWGEEPPTDSMEPDEYLAELIGRAGMTGPFELAFDALGQDSADEGVLRLSGPTLDHLVTLLSADWDKKLYRSTPILGQLYGAQSALSN
ncbi:MAG: thermonuclease family protein [Cellvibrionaceae bacterium]